MVDQIFQHLNPVWREKANFIIGAHVPPLEKSLENKAWEQLWVKRINPYRFMICCIPLFSYGFALGDEVKTDRDFMINKIIKRSGHETLRIYFFEITSDNSRDAIIKTIKNHECLMEWYSKNLLGVNADNRSKTDLIVEALSDHLRDGSITIEIANRL